MTGKVRRYGNTLTSLRSFFVSMAVIGAIVAVLTFFMEGRAKVSFVKLAAISAALGTLIALSPLVFVLPTCLFEIRIDDVHIEHRLLGRYVLSRKLLADLRKVEIGTGWGARLRFADGSSIRFLGAHLGILGAMGNDIASRVPGQVEFEGISPSVMHSLGIEVDKK